MPAPFPMPVTTASAPPARRTAVAPCRDRWTIASSIAVTTRAATRPASFELSALARCNSISCYRILEERVEPKCLAGRQLSGNCFWFGPLLLYFHGRAAV